jgi:hypothetical protein
MVARAVNKDTLHCRPDLEHSYDSHGAFGATLFVDSGSTEGVWLRASFQDDRTVIPEKRVLPQRAKSSRKEQPEGVTS